MACRRGGPGGPSDARNYTVPPSIGAEADADSWSYPERCQYRTSESQNRECQRFFDCPSHRVARSFPVESNDSAQNLAARLGGVDRNGSPASDSFGEVQRRLGPRSTTTNNHQRRGDNIIHVISATESSSSQPSPPHFAIRMETNSRAASNRFYPTPPLRTSSSTTDRIHPSPQQSRVHRSASSNNNVASEWSQTPGPGNRVFIGSSSSNSGGNSPEEYSLLHAFGFSLNGGRRSDDDSSERYLVGAAENGGGESTEVVLPRWQPDAEVTYCPICQAQFNIFVRKHHCRKCGRVVCNSCSPHRIIIPHQFIVRPPGSEVPLPQSMLVDALNGGFLRGDGLSGGERVRLCNPCVPDPNTAPPQAPTIASLSPRSAARHRSRSSFGGLASASGHIALTASRHGDVFADGQGSNGQYQQLFGSGSRNIIIDPTGQRAPSTAYRRSMTGYHSSLDQLLAVGPSSLASGTIHYGGRRHHIMNDDASSSRQRALPPRPQIAEEDECPICHLELPSRSLANFENLRENHITECIQSHSAYGSPRLAAAGQTPPAARRRTGMYTYAATEKDCVDDAECTICLEEFVVGISMARLECLCRFHRACISAWFVNHPGRCPVHQHDGFGY